MINVGIIGISTDSYDKEVLVACVYLIESECVRVYVCVRGCVRVEVGLVCDCKCVRMLSAKVYMYVYGHVCVCVCA